MHTFNILFTEDFLLLQESYVKEVSTNKVNMLLVNKADLLTREQRRSWARYFEKEGLRAVFWSALAEGNRLDAEDKVSRSGRELLLPIFSLFVLQYIYSTGRRNFIRI